MSRMLTLVHAGWIVARTSAECGRYADARIQAERLLERTDLPDSMAADAHRLAAEALIETEHYRAARRHLRAAQQLQPYHARTRYLAGLACERDPRGNDARAAARFRAATDLEPGNAGYRAAFGRALVRCGRIAHGCREMLAAVEMITTDTSTIQLVVDGLIETGRVGAAKRVLVKARFRFPNDTDLLAMWERVRFHAARVQQRKARKTQDATCAMEGDLSLLPFLRIATPDDGRKAAANIRRDVLSIRRPHLARLRIGKTDR